MYWLCVPVILGGRNYPVSFVANQREQQCLCVCVSAQKHTDRQGGRGGGTPGVAASAGALNDRAADLVVLLFTW